MNIFIIGLNKSGRTTLAKELSNELDYPHIIADWFKEEFRSRGEKEQEQHYLDDYAQWLTQRRKNNPNEVVDVVKDKLSSVAIIDGIQSPSDFVELFDFNRDFVIFLNRTDAPAPREHESIGASVIRDYCFWLASAGLIEKKRWHEFNFKIPGEESDFIKELGSKNRIFLTKNLERVIEGVKGSIKELINER